MGDPKPLASLSSSLLARKGAARPAMRRQINFAPDPVEKTGHEDLGWNDMGYDVDPPQSAEPANISGASDNAAKDNPLAGAIPEVIKQQDALGRKLQENGFASDASNDEAQPNSDEQTKAERQPEVERGINAILSTKPTAEQKTVPQAKSTKKVENSVKAAAIQARTKRAAFTLRLDPERHLRLRLACAVRNQSAQQLVTEALDEMLASLPEIDALAGQVPGSTKKH
ncbi:MAG: hypothetical protein AAGH53_00635 [Pseudomonadota bacterium]